MTPAVIFVHGLGLTGDVWAPQQKWCKEHQIESVALTLPGHGSRRNDVASVTGMVDEIIAATQHLEKVILVGHSFGGLLCALAAPKIQNIEHIILINPLLAAKQIKRSFFISMKMGEFAQQFFGVRKRPGKFAKGSKWFWRWSIYPYCLMCNKIETIEKLYLEIKSIARVSLAMLTSYTILLSQNDELLTPAVSKNSITVPFSGHMLFRLSPEEINRFLDRVLLRQMEHRV
ncbi:MAG: alpha/beta hydrolase [Candidatus Sungbacteria bacterium]|uniref:Alpha/beta hydrolase n=1 Tax=Candidatus Sungiibacteriota bacterium TaxID=2750080 RepID=A0A932VRS4_9BACT|nr:alpha/beta hydrolase [Candidatus Sungbacteria bacterium]